jgi:NRAMP (natural resistance-associated macrophage protein)-like metal ion transporter
MAKDRHERRISRARPAGATTGTRAPNLIKKIGLILGPGFVTGASDDDPSGIGTYAVAGATLGLQTLWTALLTFPLMTAVQGACARLGMVSGQGLAGILRDHYPRPLLYGSVVLLFVANTINVGADLGAIADAVHSLAHVDAIWLIVPVAAGLVGLQILGSYRLIANTFKWLTLALFAYLIDAFLVHPDFAETLRATFIPTLSLDSNYVTTLVAIFGTTISPYLFFWQSSEEVEEEIAEGRTTLQARRGATPAEIRYSNIDTAVGMGFSQVVMYFIILATALTLFKAGETQIKSAADAAEALRPLAGDFAGILFAVGMIGAGLLAVPILSCSAGYAIAEAFGWRYGLGRDWRRAKEFYGVIAAATALGVAMNVIGINPIDALFWTAVINGAVAPPLLVVVMLAARNPAVMGKQRIGPVMTVLGWIATIGMFLALIALIVTTVVR